METIYYTSKKKIPLIRIEIFKNKNKYKIFAHHPFDLDKVFTSENENKSIAVDIALKMVLDVV